MTVTDISRSGQPPEFDRTPPHDLQAEQSVLGGMLISKDAIADVIEVLRAGDFYRPAHSTVFEVIGDLYGRGDPADSVSVAAELARRDQLERVGGGNYMHTLISSVPTAANAGYYARIVAEKAVLRRLAEAGTRIVQMAYGPAADVDALVDRAQAAVYDVTEKRSNEDYAPLSDLLNPTLEEIEAIAGHEGGLTGVPTGFTDLDELTNGLHGGQMWIVAARPAVGKALALDTPLPTPTGWTTMGDVQPGDLLLGADGAPTRVVAATEVMLGRPCYEVEFSDGTVLVADAQHQWVTETHAARRAARAGWGLRDQTAVLPRPVTTEEIARTLHSPGSDREPACFNHAVTLEPETVALLGPRRRVETTRFVVDARRVESVPVRCVEVDSVDHLYLAGETWIPTHNSTLGLDFARAASIKHGLTSVIFSLEMSRMEITMRLLSAEARVSLQNIRTGRLTDDDWARLARRMGEVADAPLFIDDSPNLTMMEIRSKARRLRQRNDLRLIVLDYLQLMSSPRKVESRQQEVSEISRSLKLLAKELDIPIVAICQLNRASEQRADKRPQVADLRESGCLTGDTRLVRADTGAEVSLAELVLTGERDVPVWSVDENLRVVAARLTHAFPSGTKEVFELRMRSGSVVKASANHRFLSPEGWRRVDELATGARLAVPRFVPPPLTTCNLPDAEIVSLARAVGGGCESPGQTAHRPGPDEANLVALGEPAAHAGVTTRRTDSQCCPAVDRPEAGGGSPAVASRDDMGGFHGLGEAAPRVVFGLPKPQLALFLRHLWGVAGRFSHDLSVGDVTISYASLGRRLLDDIALLLLRFGIRTRIELTGQSERGDVFHLRIEGVQSQRVFLAEIGVDGARGASVETVLRMLDRVVAVDSIDTVPPEVWDRVRAALADRDAASSARVAATATRSVGAADWVPGRGQLPRASAVLADEGLRLVGTGDVYWEEVEEIVSCGFEPVFDATVAGTHNLVANRTYTHNSLEQDADAIILLYREDTVEKESARAGEADLIVAKHRNGPTGTITVAFQGHYSRFVDMAN